MATGKKPTEPTESRWRIANCLGTQNLAQALADWESAGVEPRFVLFCGIGQSAPSAGLISNREVQNFPMFTMIGTVFTGPKRA